MVTRDEIRNTISEILSEELDGPIVVREDQKIVEELGLDSVDVVSMVMQVERKYRIRMKHEELAEARCCGDFVTIISRKIEEAEAASPAAKAA